MGNQRETASNDSEEIELGKLLQLFRKGFNRIFSGVLRIFLYLKKNAIKLGLLIILGIAVGLLLNTFIDKKLKTEVIVKPNFQSKDYLYDVVDEIQANILTKDTLFFSNLGIEVAEIRGFEVTVSPIENKELDKEDTKERNEYLDILQNYKENDFVVEAIKSEILKNTVLTHRITFYHRDKEKGAEYASKLVGYINDNPYFNELKKVSSENALERISKNTELVEQIDILVNNYSQQLSSENKVVGREGMVLFDKEKEVDITALLSLKNRLIKEIEEKRIEIFEQNNAIKIINFGKPQEVKKQFLNKSLTLIPAIFLGIFFVVSLITYLNKRSKELIE
ncbi:hypothetical protein FK220_006970 [Flavobacteriaceae bacterium TP-CH-4]|uniref:Uncharacterized protein n=1 Tax=Pelagihabitans pacificus TaxID=2696054 RepID=A0A967E6E2_9FLAO|nr:hypothetical protein [Pelagihabitans pacificus]NHF59074.1 hypothetical protein [Pelagihabitans pacificus]